MSDRHPKWVRVEPGTVIPAGQPYRVEWEDGNRHEYPGEPEPYVYYDVSETTTGIFVDSSWKPPLVLPTEPTWGLAVIVGKSRPILGKWSIAKNDQWGPRLVNTKGRHIFTSERVRNFIPLTAEQVARIEAAR